jgi:hypothetical protein
MMILEVILRAYSVRFLGFSAKYLRWVKLNYEKFGFNSVFDGRKGKTKPTPIEIIEKVQRLF